MSWPEAVAVGIAVLTALGIIGRKSLHVEGELKLRWATMKTEKVTREAFEGWGTAMKHYGWVPFAVIVVVILALGHFKPVEQVRPVAQSLGVLAGQCPGGWHDDSAEDADAVVKSCSRDGWVVFLDADGDFSHGYEQDTPGPEFVMEPEGIPEWPSSN